jgi:REP element-mobilizing transposase RayT
MALLEKNLYIKADSGREGVCSFTLSPDGNAYQTVNKPASIKSLQYLMGRSRYKIYESTHPHFFTCTILNWLPIFTRQDSVDIVLDSLKHIQREENLKLYAYVILENHIHLVASSEDIAKSMRHFKSFTAKEILKLLQKESVTTILDQLAFYKKAHKTTTTYQIWQEGSQPKLIQTMIDPLILAL